METRDQAARRKKKRRQQDASYHASLSPEELAQRRAKKAKHQRIVRKMKKEKAQAQSARLTQLQAEVEGKQKHIDALYEEIHERWENFEFKTEEPEGKDDVLRAAHERYLQARKYPRTFEDLTGETLESFDDLYAIVEEELALTNYRGERRARRGDQRQRLPDITQLFITLLFLRQYPTYALLSWALGGMPDWTLHHYVHRVLRALQRVDALKVKWPTEDELNAYHQSRANCPYPWARNVVAATDGTEIKVARPTTGAIRNPHYSAKKRQYALNVLLIVLLNGLIIFCSKPTAKMNDQGLWNELNLRERFVSKPYGIIADGGFTLNYSHKNARRPEDIKAFVPNKRPRRKKGTPKDTKGPSLTDEQKKFNVELSRLRVVVENTNARLKRYKVVGSKLRHYHPAVDADCEKGISPALIVAVVAGLTNRWIKKNPCRPDGWQPKVVTPDDLNSLEGSDAEEELDKEGEEDE